ncbi:MAG TPA: methyltransferase domain-containing protein [Microthrixaceae bacterium]|nr:methyltransferase domain-containing protein [Microthrixaceae bacterium]
MVDPGKTPSLLLEPDPERIPRLAGVERPLFDYLAANVWRADDPFVETWIEYEESQPDKAVAAVDRLPIDGLDGKRVLDVGSQNGAVLVELARRGAVATGIEIDPGYVEAARIRLDCHGMSAEPVTASATDMPFEDETFDLVMSADVIEHVDDKWRTITESARVLKPGGVLLIVAPLRFAAKHVLRDPHYGKPVIALLPGKLAGTIGTRWMGLMEYEVETLPTVAGLKRLLRKAGLKVESSSLADGHWLTTLPGPLATMGDELRHYCCIVSRKPV